MTDWTGRPLLSLLADKEEDRLTEFLLHLLQSPEVRRAFVEGLADVRLSDATLASLQVRAQVPVPGGRPDLTLTGGSTYILVEAKVGAWLHEDQLVPYAKALLDWRLAHPDGTLALVLLAPARSGRGLSEAAHTMLESLGFPRDALHLVTWEDVARLCRTLAPGATPPRLQVHLEDFAGLIEHRLDASPRALTQEEVGLLADPTVGTALVQVRYLADEAVKGLERALGPTLQVTAASGGSYLGYTLRWQGRWWWFGLWLNAWAKTGTSPLVLQLPGLHLEAFEALTGATASPRAQASPDGNGLVLPLPLRSQIAPSHQVELLVAALTSWLRERPESGGAGAAPKAG